MTTKKNPTANATIKTTTSSTKSTIIDGKIPVAMIAPIAIIAAVEESSEESDIEQEPARIFHRRVSTKRDVNTSVAIKEGFLMKQTWSFQRWRQRYFRLKRKKLYYAKDPKCDVFDEIELSDLCCAECSTKNVNHSFQVITPTRSLVLCAESRPEMEDWLSALKQASAREYYEAGLDQHDFLSNHHHWYATSHARPTYCNVCRDALSGVTSHGLSCEVCKCKVHKRCAVKAIANCKWTTLASVGKDIIEEKDGSIVMPHQWMEGNLPVASICAICKKTCGSVLRLQDWRCLWCRATVHTACRPQVIVSCPLGPAKVSVVPPTSVHSIGIDEAWDVISPKGNFSPLLVFVNSKSGDNQGVKFLRRFKQLLNPAQVFDLISTGPSLGLRLFRHFDLFRILVCSGDGSVGWVLSEIDRFDMHKQCQVAVLPLGTGNDLARVLGWGSSCDDDAHLPQILERYETASTKMLDRWSIMVFEKAISVKTPKLSLSNAQEAMLTGFVESANWHLQSIVEADDFQVLITSTKVLCETVDELLVKICENKRDDEQLSLKCDILRQKLNMLFEALKVAESGQHGGDDLVATLNNLARRRSSVPRPPPAELLTLNISMGKTEKDKLNTKERRNSRSLRSTEKEALQCRANSIKRAIYSVVEHTEPGRPKRYQRKLSIQPYEALKVQVSSQETSPCTSPHLVPPINVISPSVSTNRLTCISPFPDDGFRRDSVDDNFFCTISLPVPMQFADSRRSSGVPSSAENVKGINNDDKKFDKYSSINLQYQQKQFIHISTNNGDTNKSTYINDSDATTAPTDITLGSIGKNINHNNNNLNVPNTNNNQTNESMIDPLGNFRPIEIFERTMYMAREIKAAAAAQQEIENNKNNISICAGYNCSGGGGGDDTEASTTLQVPNIVIPCHNQEHSNVYTSETLTIIDTDVMLDPTLSEELPGEASDILSAISNEECSVTSEILDKPTESYHQQHFHIADIIQDLTTDRLTHIDSPETSDETEAMQGESLMDDISSVLGHDMMRALQDNTITEDITTMCTDGGTTSYDIKKSMLIKKRSMRRRSSPPRVIRMDSDDNPQQFGFENIVFEIDNRCDDQKVRKDPIRYCSLAQFVEGNDIARKSFKRPNRSKSVSYVQTTKSEDDEKLDAKESINLSSLKLQIADSDVSDTETIIQPISTRQHNHNGMPKAGTHEIKRITFDESCKKESLDDEDPKHPEISVIVRPPTPLRGDKINMNALLTVKQSTSEIRRHSSHSPSLTVREYDKELDRRHSGINPNLLTLDPEHAKFLSSSPAASRRISCGSLYKPNESLPPFGGSKSSLFMGSTLFGLSPDDSSKDDKKSEKDEPRNKKLPIINPLVRLPAWPNISAGSGFISKCLLANADTLCAAVSPLMDPDETLLEGYHEKCVMNNYFGIGIDAKISLDFHNKREEHPEKCRSRAKNYMWYGVLGSKQFLQKTYKNLEQRVQLECDGQRIPLPSLQGLVVLNIPSFMGGTNFWGGTKSDDIFLGPSFDDRILEVVAVFGSVQMAASRLINLQHHRIAQCQSVQINILGDEEVPIQVDGEAWLQPPGMIRIIHKNRVQMLCRNRHLEISLRQWQDKQRQHSISIQRDQPSTTSDLGSIATTNIEDLFSEQESYILLNFIEAVSSLVKWVKFLIISHPSLEADLYAAACTTSDALESTHPNGKLLDGPDLRIKLADVVQTSKQLYEDSCSLLRDRGQSLVLREDLESKLSISLANMEMELRKCMMQKCPDGKIRAYFNILVPNEEADTRKKSKPFWLRFRPGATGSSSSSCQVKPTTNTRDAVNNWGVNEVVTWLETMQLSEYVDSFVKNDIRGKELLTLGRRDLKDLGVVKVGHVKRILQAIKDLGEK